MQILTNKTIMLGVTGSIACYKALNLVSELIKAQAKVDVLLSPCACRFVTPLAFSSLTHRPTITDLFAPSSELHIDHIAVAKRADLALIAPATANTVAKIACGFADNALTTTILATQAPIIVAPAMESHMYSNPVTQENLNKLRTRGMTIAGPTNGRLASGEIGPGRMMEASQLLQYIFMNLREKDLNGYTMVVSAGGTQEPIDPVRMVANRSSGKMGYAIATAARDRGAKVVLVSAPSPLEPPMGVELISVDTALTMRNALLHCCQNADVLVMAAAVADWRPREIATKKIKKTATSSWSLEMEKNPDILCEITYPDLIKIGFAAESHDLLANAKAKLRNKGLHMIVANDITLPDRGFGADKNKVSLIDNQGTVTTLPLMEKLSLAHNILNRIVPLLQI